MKCLKGTYTGNDVVLHAPLVCFGGYGQPPCKHLEKCLNDNGHMIKILKSGKRAIRRLPAPQTKRWRDENKIINRA